MQPSDVSLQVVGKVTEAMTAGFAALAKQAGVAADHFYPIFVKQQVIDGYIWLGYFIILFAITGVILALCFKGPWLVRNNDYDSSLTRKGIGMIIVAFMSLVLLISTSWALPICIMQIINPEYYAVKDITNMGANILNPVKKE